MAPLSRKLRQRSLPFKGFSRAHLPILFLPDVSHSAEDNACCPTCCTCCCSRSSPVCARQHCMRCCSATEAGKGHHHASVWCDEPLLPRRSSTEAGKGHPAPAGISVRATAGTASPAAPAGGTAAEGAALKPAGGTPSAGPAPAGGAETLWPRGTCAQRYWSCPGAAGYKIRGPTYLRVRLCMRLQLRMSFWVSLLSRRVPCMQVWPF